MRSACEPAGFIAHRTDDGSEREERNRDQQHQRAYDIGAREIPERRHRAQRADERSADTEREPEPEGVLWTSPRSPRQEPGNDRGEDDQPDRFDDLPSSRRRHTCVINGGRIRLPLAGERGDELRQPDGDEARAEESTTRVRQQQGLAGKKPIPIAISAVSTVATLGLHPVIDDPQGDEKQAGRARESGAAPTMTTLAVAARVDDAEAPEVLPRRRGRERTAEVSRERSPERTGHPSRCRPGTHRDFGP